MDGTNRRLVLGVRVGFCETGRPERDGFPVSEAASRAIDPGGAVTPFRKSVRYVHWRGRGQ